MLRNGHLITQGTLADVIAMAGTHGHRVEVPPDQVDRAVQILSAMDLGEVRVVDAIVVTQRQLDDPGRITYALGMQGIFLRGLQTMHATL